MISSRRPLLNIPDAWCQFFYKPGKSQEMRQKRRLRKKLRRQGAQIKRNEAYFYVRRSDEGRSATRHPDFLRSRQFFT
jgi:hypothetical protein